uniref:Uncharacterized protein n=1 Tax=Rhizophora mucronata TaxID=61149 RepID=A0A2P2QL56_RHIMU
MGLASLESFHYYFVDFVSSFNLMVSLVWQ